MSLVLPGLGAGCSEPRNERLPDGVDVTAPAPPDAGPPVMTPPTQCLIPPCQPPPCIGAECDAGAPAPPDATETEMPPPGMEYPTECPGGVVRHWELPAEPRSVDFSSDGLRVAAGAADGTVTVHNVIDGRELGRHNKHLQRIQAVRFAPNGQSVAAASDDGTLSHWTIGPGAARTWVHGGVVHSVAFAPDGNTMAVGGQGVYIVRTATLVMAAHFNGTNNRSVAFLPGGQEILAADGGENAARIVVLRATDLSLLRIQQGTHPNPGLRLAVPARNAVFVVYSLGPRLMTSALGQSLVAWFDQHAAPIEELRFSDDGTRLVTAGADATRVWTVATWNVQRTWPGGSSVAAFSPDGKRLARQHGRRVLIHCLE